MCMTDYIKERAQAIERDAQAKIDIIEEVLPELVAAAARAEALPRAGGLVILFLSVQAQLIEEKAAALRVIESACELQRNKQEVA